jgi:hypothetical protein
MAMPVVELSREGYKIRKVFCNVSFLLKINCIQMKLPIFEIWSDCASFLKIK